MVNLINKIMIKKSILIENKSSITAKNLQLVIKSEIRESSIPIEEIGFLVLDNPENLFEYYCYESDGGKQYCNYNLWEKPFA